MPLDPHDLAACIASLTATMRHLDHELVDQACNIASDILHDTTTDRAADDSVIDAIRWGHRAAVTCEDLGGVVLRIRAKGGKAVSHEWLHPVPDLDLARIARQIEDAITLQGAS